MRPYVDQGSIKSITKLSLCREISLFKLLSCRKSLISPSSFCSIDWTLHFSIDIPKFASVSSNRGYGWLVLKMCREVFFSINSMEIWSMLAPSCNFHTPLQSHCTTGSGFQGSNWRIFFLCACASAWLVIGIVPFWLPLGFSHLLIKVIHDLFHKLLSLLCHLSLTVGFITLHPGWFLTWF